MSDLSERIEKDYLQVYKARDEVRVAVLRLLKTAIKNSEVELMRPLTDDDVLDIIIRQVKQRAESIEQFRAAGRHDLADREALEEEILNTYLPAPLTSEELAALIDESMAALSICGLKDMGRLMRSLSSSTKGRVSGKELSRLVRERLS